MSDEDVLKATSEFESGQKSVAQIDDSELGRTAQTSWKHFCKVTPTKEESEVVQDELDCVTTCYICDETYRNPMILSCVHTFCLPCLQHIGTHTGKNPGDRMPCPLCREEFKIPEDDFTALKKNVLMESMIEIRTTQEGATIACNRHTNENLCLFCSDCKEVICFVCLRECHPHHRLADLNTAKDTLRSQLQCNVSIAKQWMSDASNKKDRLLQKKNSVLENMQNVETEVYQVRRDLKALIDRHADSLLNDLGMLKKERIEYIEREQKELDKLMDSLKNFEICCAELASNDRHNGLFCKMASELNEHIVQLKLSNESTGERQILSFGIHITRTEPTSFEIYKTRNIIGDLKETIDYSAKPELEKRIITRRKTATGINGITGMAVTNTSVFIAFESSPVVSVFDSHTGNCTAQMTLTGFVREMDLKHCVSDAVNVYIVNGWTREILRIDQNRDVMKLSMKNDWGRLSISEESTIVAACYETSALREYSLQGTLLHEIKLCPTIVHPQHAIKLGNGHFVVSHGCFKDAVNRVCLVDEAGAIKKSFGCMRGSGIHQLNGPVCLAVDENENVLVLDRNNSRVLLLSPELEFRRDLLTKADGLRRPVAMHMDGITRKLYIADNNCEHGGSNESQVLVFSIK